MNTRVRSLHFIWWNVQDFAHFDISRANEKRWPASSDEYAEKLQRVAKVLHLLCRKNAAQLIALAEITDQASEEIRNRLFPGFNVHSLSRLYSKPDFHVAIIYDPSVGFDREDFLMATNVPNTTRPMATLDLQSTDHLIRFYVCHWTARFNESSEKWRRISASHLNESVYEFLHPAEAAKQIRHVVILGDLNEEPYGILQEYLYAERNRAYSKQREHFNDRYTKKVRLYNCSWRLLGEHSPHPRPIDEREMAGSYYWREERCWHTFDQVIVSGSLLQNTPPYLDEESLRIASRSDILPSDLLGDDSLPRKFEWNNGNPKGVSDHLPLTGRVILK